MNKRFLIILIFYTGSKFIGEWKDGGRWHGIQYNKNGNIYLKWRNGRRMKKE